jgi:CAAX prenyl protease-like protein
MNLFSFSKHPAHPYVTPFVLFMLFLFLEQMCTDYVHPGSVYVIYPIKTLVVGLLLVYIWQRLPPLNLNRPWGSVAIGIACFVIWVAADWLFRPLFGPRSGGFNPTIFMNEDSMFIGWELVAGLIAFRMLGAVVLVPIMEELFWRGFMMRYLIRVEFEKEPLGRYTHFSFWGTTGLFVFVHAMQDWPGAVLVGIIFGFWFVHTKSLGNVILAHAITNLALGIYVIITRQWYFW